MRFIRRPASVRALRHRSFTLSCQLASRWGGLRHTVTTLPHLSLVFITGHGDIHGSVRAMKGGAVDFLEKPVDGDALLPAIRRAAARSRALKASHEERVALERRYAEVTRREREVFALVTSGLMNKQIAADLGVTEKTIKVHRARVMEKMGAKSLADLVRKAERLGA